VFQIRPCFWRTLWWHVAYVVNRLYNFTNFWNLWQCWKLNFPKCQVSKLLKKDCICVESFCNTLDGLLSKSVILAWTARGFLQSLNLSSVLLTQQLEPKLISVLQSVVTLEKLDLSDCCLSHGFGVSTWLLFLQKNWITWFFLWCHYFINTIRDAILTCAQKPTWFSLIYRTEPTTKKCKNRKTKKVENTYAQR